MARFNGFMRKIANLSPNFNKKSRQKNKIKFVVIHYTGMQSEIVSLKRLTDKHSKVSAHYFIGKNGKIVQLVKENKVAWHAGKSKWKKFRNLNKYSVGIELANKGHEFGYERFSKKQINSLIILCLKLKRKYKLENLDFLGHSDIAPLRKIDPGEKFPWERLSKFKIGSWYKNLNSEFFNTNKKEFKKLFFKNLYRIGYRYFNINKRQKNDKKIIEAFQRHYLPKKITGKIDPKTLKISHFLANNHIFS